MNSDHMAAHVEKDDLHSLDEGENGGDVGEEGAEESDPNPAEFVVAISWSSLLC